MADDVGTASVSPEFTANAHKAQTLLLRRIAQVTQVRIAAMVGCDNSTISRLLSDGSVDRFAHIIAALDLQLVPADHQTFDPAKLTALMTLADDGLRSLRASVTGKSE